MGFFGKLFGKKSDPLSQPPLSANAPKTITVFDGYGREFQIDRKAWRDDVLPGNLKKAWDNPEDLAQLVIQAMRDEFFAEVLPAAEHLIRIDKNHERAACVLGIVYLKLNRLADAERVFGRYIGEHGATASILTNLAKVYAGRGETQRTEQTVWRALEFDANSENAFGWHYALARERGGEAAANDALRRIAALPKAWRARVWLARTALAERRLDDALALYHEALELAPRPVPTEMLQQMSGDLGNHAHLPEILDLVGPHFDVAYHGFAVGNNLIKANIDLGRLDAARALLDQHYAQKRFDWQQGLAFWDTEIGKARVSLSPHLQEIPETSMLSIDAPIWLRASSPAAELFPVKPSDAQVVCLLGASVEYPAGEQTAQAQLADIRGRLSRSLPLFLSEQIYFRTAAVSRVLQPWLKSRAAFVVSGVAWKPEDAATYARQHERPSDFIAICHLATTNAPWKATLRLVRTIDAKVMGEADTNLDPHKPEDAFFALARALVRLLGEHAGVTPESAPTAYVLPMLNRFASYQLRLEQALVLAGAALEIGHAEAITGEREIIDGNLQLCVDEPTSITTRLLLVESLRLLKKVRPSAIPEFRDKLALLQKEKPLSQPAHAVVQRMVDEIFKPTLPS